MTTLAPERYLDHIRTESQRFRDVLADCDPAARVPGCPDWDAADLLFHLAGVQHFWSTIIRQRPAGSREARGAGAPGDVRRAARVLRRVLRRAGRRPSRRRTRPSHAWSWAPEQTVGFTFRRQAHEALIHRLDAEQAAGSGDRARPASSPPTACWRPST